MRRTLMPLDGQTVSGTARVAKQGHKYLLRDIRVEDNASVDTDILLAKESHLWTDAATFDKYTIPKNFFFYFIGKVYEYNRKNGTTDYSIKINKITPINPFTYFSDRAHEVYCRCFCKSFKNCYYDDCNEERNRINDFCTSMCFGYIVKFINTLQSENPDFDLDDFLKTAGKELL